MSGNGASPAAGRARFINPKNQEVTDEIDDRLANGRDADDLIQSQRDILAAGYVTALALGQDPNAWRPPQSTGLHSEVELEAWAHQQARLMAGKKRIYDEEGLSQVTDLRRKIVQAYKERKEANATGDPAEAMPLEIDPNLLADARFRIAKIHNRIRKEVDPKFNAYQDPYLGVLSLSMTEGNLAVSGAQPMKGNLGILGEGAELAFAPIRGILDAGFEFGYGLASLGNRLILGLSDGRLGMHVQEPTHGVVDEDGHLWTNAGKVSGFGHIAAMAQAMVYGQVTEDVAQIGDTIALKEAQRHGLEWFCHSAAYGIGSFAGMGAGAKPLTAMARKGLTWLGALGRTKKLTSSALELPRVQRARYLAQLERLPAELAHAKRAARLLDLGSGAVGFSMYEAIAHGESEGYGKAALHGMALGLLAGGLGLLGRRTEKFLVQKKVPAVMARAFAGMTEGFGFSVPTQEVWDLIRDPSEETWSRYAEMMAVNVAAMGILKTFGQTPSEHILSPELVPKTKSPAPKELQEEAAAELSAAESVARELHRPEPHPSQQEDQKRGAPKELLRRGPRKEAFPPREQFNLDEAIAEIKRAKEEGRPMHERSALMREALEKAPASLSRAVTEAAESIGREWGMAKDVMLEVLSGAHTLQTLMTRGARIEDVKASTKEALKEVIQREHPGMTPEQVAGEAKEKLTSSEARLDAKRQELMRELEEKNPDWSVEQLQAAVAKRYPPTGPTPLQKAGQAITSAEQMGKARPELKVSAFEAVQRARQELAAETRGPKSPERVTEEREDLNNAITNRSFPAARGIEPVEGAEPIRASDIIKRMQGVRPEDPIKFPIRVGRAGHNAKGWFSSQENLVRQENALDLNNGAHEFAHAMQDRTIGLKWKPSKGPIRDELLEIGRPLYNENWPLWRRINEGWAEFWARDLLGDASLEASFPNAHRFLKAWISAPEQAAVLNQYKHIAEGLQNWRDQGSKKRVRMSRHMHGDPKSPEQKAERGSIWSRIKKRLDIATDDIAGLKHPMQRFGIEKGDIPIIADPHRVASIHRGKAQEVANTFIWRATISQTGERTGESLHEAFSGIKDSELNDLLDYIQSRISLEMIAKGKITQLPKEDYLAVIADTAARGLTEKYETAGRRIKGVFDRAIDYSMQHGAVSEVSGQLIKDSNSLYIPFFRIIEGAPERGGSPPRGVAERGTGLYRRKGSTRELKDPMQGMVELLTSVIAKSHMASVMKSSRMLSLIEPGLGGLMTKVHRDVRPIKLDVDRLRAELDKLGYDVTTKEGISEADMATILTLFEPVQRPTGHEAIVEYAANYTDADIEFIRSRAGDQAAKEAEKERGKAGWYEMDPEWFKTMQGVEAGHTNTLIQGAAFLTRMQKLGAVGLQPGFHAFNMFKDSLTLAIFGSSKLPSRYVPVVGGIVEMAIGAVAQTKGRGPISYLLKKVGKEPAKVDIIAQRLRDAGGKGSTYLGETLQRKGKSYEGITEKDFEERLKGTLMHPARAVLHLLEKMESALSETELFARTREYKLTYERAKAAGKGEVEAHYEGLEAAAEITQNFIRNGVTVRGLSRIITFFGARVGGARRVIRALGGYDGTRTQLQAWLGGAGTLTTLGILSYLLHGDEDRWNTRPDWLKNNFWTFFFGDLEVTIPKNQDLGKLMSNPAEYVLGVVFGTEKRSAWDMLGEVFIDELRGYATLPTFFGPSVEALMNYSMFTGKQIVPSWMSEALPPEQRHHIYTTWIARQIGKVFNVSPLKVEHILRQHTGGVGLSVSRAVDEVFNLGNEIRRDHYVPTSQETLAEIPFLGRFFAQHPFEQSADVSRFYSLHKELNQRKDPRFESLRLEMGRARQRLSDIFRAAREGRMSRQEADQQAFRIAEPFIDRYERIDSSR